MNFLDGYVRLFERGGLRGLEVEDPQSGDCLVIPCDELGHPLFEHMKCYNRHGELVGDFTRAEVLQPPYGRNA